MKCHKAQILHALFLLLLYSDILMPIIDSLTNVRTFKAMHNDAMRKKECKEREKQEISDIIADSKRKRVKES